MKKYAIIGLIVAALVFAACGKGGSIEVTNQGDDYAIVSIMKGFDGTNVVGAEQRVEAGNTVTFSVDEDGNYTVSAVYVSPAPGTFARKHITVTGGDTVRTTVTNTK